MKSRFQISRFLPAIFLLLYTSLLHAIPPVLNYAGQVAVDGEPFQGTGLFKFALIKGDNNTTIWSNDGSSVNGSEPLKSVSTSVDGGLYSILLGNSSIKGMSSLIPSIFQKHSNIKLRVWFSDGINGFEQLSPDRSFASVPYAFSAGSAPISQGSINRKMLSADVRSDLNSSLKKITRDMLPKSVLEDLNSSIKKIKRDMLPDNVLAQLDRKLARSDLPADVLTDLNRTIQLNRLSSEVLSALQVTPSISTEPFARYYWRTDSATIEARGRGHNISYQWLKNGQVISGANAPVLELSNPVLDDNATYSVQLTNSVGQTTSQTITLQQAIGAPGIPHAEANTTQVPRNGLVLWLDANDLNADGLADNLPTGTLIDSWKSKVGDTDATQSTELLKPKSNFFGDTNLKAVAFDGGDYLLDDNASLPVQHIFAVYRGNFDRNDVMISNETSNLIQVYTDHGSRFLYGDFFKEDGGTIRVSGKDCPKYESHNYKTWQTDLLTTSSGYGGSYTGTINKLGIGAKTATDNHWEGEFGEILFYNRALSNTERDAVERYLADKWNIQLHADKIAAEQAAYDAALPVNEPEDGLQAYYKFEPASLEPNKLWDHSGNQRHLNLSGFTGDPWSEGVEGQALMFDGINDKVTGSFDSKFRTMSFWLCPEVAVNGTNSELIIFQGHGPHLYLDKQYLKLNKSNINGSGHFQFHKESSTYIESSPNYNVTHNTWFHLALVSSNDQASDELSTKATYDFYINGNKIDVLRSSGDLGLLHTSRELNLGVGSFHGRLDEFRAYDRPLLPFEIQAFHNSIKKPLINLNFEHNATVGTNFSLSLAADNGPTTYLAEGLPAGLSLNVSTGQITGTVSQPGYHRVFVKAMNEHGTGSDTIAIIARPQADQYGWPVDIPDGSDIPKNGLVLWLDANDVDADGEFDTGTDHLKLANWADKAGKDHNATQANAANQPEIRSGQISGKPNLNVLVFDGNQFLSFPTIGQGRTFFWVIKMHPDTSEHANFFSYTSSTLWGINGKPASYGKQALKLNGYSESVISNGNWKVNGNSVNQNDFISFSPTTISLVSSDLASSNLIGRHNSESLPGDLIDSFFSGNICEILIYDQALTSNQIETVEKYLGQKWGISISHDTTPSPSGNPPTYQVTPANDSVTTAHLTEQILKYLKPEITAQPQANNVYADTNYTFSVTAEGKYLTYQWKKNGTNLVAETNATLTITDANATQHDGNYSVVVSNDFGSEESTKVSVFVANEVLDGLVGWWPLDGNASDFSGGQNHGTISGNPLWVTGKIGHAVRFNSVNQKISTNSNFGTQNSISLWCNFSSTSSGQFQMVWSFSNPNLAFDSSTVSLNSMDSSDNKFADFSALQFANQWLHFVTVNTSSQTELYLNAASIGTANYVSPSSNNFVIGKGGYTLNGIVDEVRIYDRALSNSEIQTLYNLGQ